MTLTQAGGQVTNDERMGTMDYRLLLWKYIRHVGRCEGVTFVEDIGAAYSGIDFTDDEQAELMVLDEMYDSYVQLRVVSEAEIPLTEKMRDEFRVDRS